MRTKRCLLHLIYHPNRIDLLNAMNMEESGGGERVKMWAEKLFYRIRSDSEFLHEHKKWNKKKIVSLLKVCHLSHRTINQWEKYIIYTHFKIGVESFWQCWFWLKWLMRCSLEINGLVYVFSPTKICWYKSMMSERHFAIHITSSSSNIHPLMSLIKFFCYSFESESLFNRVKFIFLT